MKNPFRILDVYVIKSFIAPFFLWTVIALFVLLLQMMWVYIDEIMGKGAGLFFITEMLFYLSVFLVPQALLIGVLTSSVMTVGGLAENYELSSMKSAGLSLIRIMRPIMLFCIGIGIFSYICSDFLSPLAKLKYNARMYDIRKQPTLALEEGVFSDNFPGYTIRVGKKSSDGRRIEDVMIYQTSRQTTGGSVTLSEVLAKSGEMFTTPDEQFMIMHLNEGRRYERAGNDGEHRFSFIRTSFKEWNKIFEIAELERTDEKLFGNNQATKTVSRLRRDIDSIGNLLLQKKIDYGKIYQTNFSGFENKQDTTQKPYEVEINQQKLQPALQNKPDSRYRIVAPVDSQDVIKQQLEGKPLSVFATLLQTFPPQHRSIILSRAKGNIESILSQTTSNAKSFDKIRESQAKHICELHTKFLMAVMCVVFIFIGAPMGAIVRKGGFGFPLLIAISFFIIYIFMYIMFRKLGEQGTIRADWAIWFPCFILACIGAYLTWHANNDTKVFNADRFKRIFRIFKKVNLLLSNKFKRKTNSSINP